MQDFNIVVSDINLPKISDFSLLRPIEEVGKSAPIIFITTFNSRHNVEATINLGAETFLHRPFSLQRRYGALLMTLGKARSGRMSLGRGYFYDTDAKELFAARRGGAPDQNRSHALEILVANAGNVVSFERLEPSAWRYKQTTPNTMRMYINKLCAKTYRELIINMQRYGYKLGIPQREG